LFLITLSQRLLFLGRPTVVFCLFIIIWAWLLPWDRIGYELKYSSLVFFSLLGVGRYVIIITGWSRISRFAKLGSLRGILQNLSFEVALILIFISVLIFFHRFSIKREINIKEELILVWVSIWLLLSLIESNRAPFDLLEGERELISGFNIEIGSLTFVYLFLREYGILIILSFIAGVALYGKTTVYFIIFMSFLLFIRSCFPRVRYDVIIRIMWERVLPFGVLFFIVL
jgi:NADH-ubiquinone oxidoreductase chain 1